MVARGMANKLIVITPGWHNCDDNGHMALRRRIYTPNDVAVHNSAGVRLHLLCSLCFQSVPAVKPLIRVYFLTWLSAQDCWVSFYHKVFDLTSLLQQNHGM